MSDGFQNTPLRGQRSMRHLKTTITLGGLQERPIQSQSSTRRSHTSLYMVTGKNDYNDDAFGFVFLGSLALTQDPIFAGSFFTLSAVAAIATRSGNLPATKAVPAAVAGASLILAILLRALLSGQEDMLGTDLTSSLPENTEWIQVGLCTVSMVYGFVMAAREEENMS